MNKCYQPSISSTFFGALFCTNVLFGSFSSYVSALAPKFRTKNARVNVDEIDTWTNKGGRGRGSTWKKDVSGIAPNRKK